MPLSAHLWQSPAHRVRTMLSGAFVDTNSHATDNSRTAVNSHSARTVCNTCMRECKGVNSHCDGSHYAPVSFAFSERF